jgi:hypothetical protein
MPYINVGSKFKKFILILTCIITGLIGMSSGCDNNSYQSSTTQSATSGTPYFPVATGKNGMEALATGTLILENRYLRLSHSYYDTTHLIIWPKGYTLDKDSDGILILNEDGQFVARIGDTISAAGGEMKNMFNLWLVGVFVPLNCEGPYWITDDVWIT